MIASANNQWRYFLTAIMFFTRIPVHFEHFDEADLNKSTRFFPLVGILDQYHRIPEDISVVSFLCAGSKPYSLQKSAKK